MRIVMPLSTNCPRQVAPEFARDSAVQVGLPNVIRAGAANEWIPTGTLLVGEREHRLYILEPEKIEYIEAQGNYVKLRASSADYISRDSIKRLSHILAANGFIRIERSLLINIHAIVYAERTGRGRYSFTLTSGLCLHSGASYRNAILQVLPLTQFHGAPPSPGR